jgi:hypothetical protein
MTLRFPSDARRSTVVAAATAAPVHCHRDASETLRITMALGGQAE